MKYNKLIKWVAVAHIIVAVEIFLFWILFFAEIIFPKDLLSQRIMNFDGYYAWESSFVFPDSLMASAMLVGAFRLIQNVNDRLGRTVLIAASGGCIFLGVLDFAYDFANGMYGLDHLFSFILLSVGLFMPPFGLASIYLLYKNGNRID
jgi:hypothetical protein